MAWFLVPESAEANEPTLPLPFRLELPPPPPPWRNPRFLLLLFRHRL